MMTAPARIAAEVGLQPQSSGDENNLERCTPNWVRVRQSSGRRFDFEAAPLRADGSPTRTYRLSAKISVASIVEVQEQNPGTLLPASCPQRHINSDGTFCLSIHGRNPVETQKDALTWWDRLRLYLNCQEVAAHLRTWPKGAQLSHGRAGEVEEKAEGAARTLGKLAEYHEAVRYGTGPLARAIKLYDAKANRLRNGRAICVCGWRARSGRLKLRRECHRAHDACLIELEFQRKSAESLFWQGTEQKCCGTMDVCPLATRQLLEDL